MHLFPLWSGALHHDVDRFASDAGVVSSTDLKKPQSNAKVESYFRSMKCSVVTALRQRPSAFLRQVLVNVKGRLNEGRLPAKTTRKRQSVKAELTDIPEKWQRRKTSKGRQSKYMDAASVAKVLTTTPRPTALARYMTADSELSNDELDELLLLLRTVHSDVAGLQPPGLGTCVKGKSLPRFSRDRPGRRFVQIVNTGDHWICLTNKFSRTVNEVFVFDSMASSGTVVKDQLVVFATSLMRRYDDCTCTVTFRVRQFQQQTKKTRLCGFYAAAAAIACCNDMDPTAQAFDEVVLQREIRERIATADNVTAQLNRVEPIPYVAQFVTNPDLLVDTKPELYCLCHGPDNGNIMTECTLCGNWYHDTCLPVKPSREAKRRDSTQWLGPCCDVDDEHVVAVDLTQDNDDGRRRKATNVPLQVCQEKSVTSKFNKHRVRFAVWVQHRLENQRPRLKSSSKTSPWVGI